MMPCILFQQRNTARICVLALILLTSNECVQATTTFYTQHKIRQVSNQDKGPFFVQLGSFHTNDNAKNYIRRLKKQTRYRYPLTIKQHGMMYAVVMGPITSTNAINAFIFKHNAQFTRHIKPSHIAPVAVVKVTPIIPAIQTPSQKITTSTIETPIFKGGKDIPQEDDTSTINFLRSHGFIQADIGLSAASSTDSMTVNNGAVDPYPANVDIYSTQQNKPGGMASFMAGFRWQQDRTYIPAYSIALRYQNMFNQAVSGVITQYSDPEFNNYNYTWSVQSNVLSLLSKINLVEYNHFLPYVDIGLGYAMNRSGQYQETAVSGIVARIDSPNFSAQSSSQFSYDLGAGIDYQFNPHLLFSVGYEYQNLGGIHSGNGQAPWSSDQLQLGHYSTNTVLFSLGYLFSAS